MDLSIDNKIQTKSEVDNEVGSFIKELTKTLEKQNFSTTLENEIYKEIPLAIKYKDQIHELTNKYMIELSNDRDFFYFDYDRNKKSYYLDYYSNGKVKRFDMSKEDSEGLKKGWLYAWYDKENIVESVSLKQNIKINVESDLESFEKNNKIKR